MHPHTEELLAHLDEHRANLHSALAACPAALRETKPEPDRWSVAEVLEHLATVEQQVTALLHRGLQAAQAHSPLPPDRDDRPVLASLDGARLLDRERRLLARPAVRPTGRLTAEAAWRELERSRPLLRTVVLTADGLDTSSIHAPHPFLGELTFAQWVAFLGFHEARHAAQIRATTHQLHGT